MLHIQLRVWIKIASQERDILTQDVGIRGKGDRTEGGKYPPHSEYATGVRQHEKLKL